jgi:hypothetical protein
MAIPAENHGIRLRRLADIGAGRQAADISVDGQPVGHWYSADINPVLRWAELDFDVPEGFTRGRSSIDVEIDARQSPTPWTAYSYTVFSFRDRRRPHPVPSRGDKPATAHGSRTDGLP